jgi:hypothetical protein
LPTNTDLLDRHLPSRSVLPPRGETEESLADLGAFGWLRGVHERAAMLAYVFGPRRLTETAVHRIARTRLPPITESQRMYCGGGWMIWR